MLRIGAGLEPGMVISIELMLTLPHGAKEASSCREPGILLITANGAQNTTGYPYRPDSNIMD